MLAQGGKEAESQDRGGLWERGDVGQVAETWGVLTGVCFDLIYWASLLTSWD